MSEVVVIGGSVAGLASAYTLAEQGYDVRVVERDPQRPPETVADAHGNWRRPTVPQGSHSHAFGSLGTNLLSGRAPSIYAAMLAAGARPVNIPENPPPTLLDFQPEDADSELNVLCTRRSTFELVLRQQVLAHPRVSLVTGSTARAFTFAHGDNRRITGVAFEDGSTLPAEFVVDAMGRKSQANRWLMDYGLSPMEVETNSAEITYYTRFYQMTTDRPPGILNRGFGSGGTWDHYTAVLFLGDNNTFSISVGVLPDDTVMKNLRHEEAFTAAVRATPLLAPWVSPSASTPISPVYAMGGLDNTLRGAPPVTGLFSVGDSACTTNPAYGRGVSLALKMAFDLGDVIGAHENDIPGATREYADLSHRMLKPWFMDATMSDFGRTMLWRAVIGGTTPPSPPPGIVPFSRLVGAAAADQVVWRNVVRMMNLLAPAETLRSPEIAQRVNTAYENGSVFEFPGAGREQLVRAVTATVPSGAV